MSNQLYDSKTAKTIETNLDKQATELIDFDQLRQLLSQSVVLAESHQKISSELEILKEDYRARIIGMLKASIACRKDESDIELIESLSQNLADLDCGHLLKIYRTTAARFRTNFPATFKYAGLLNTVRHRDWKEHKL